MSSKINGFLTSKGNNIIDKILIHVVPFRYNQSYSEFVNNMKNRGYETSEWNEDVENDLYDYIQEELNDDDNSLGTVLFKENSFNAFIAFNPNGEKIDLSVRGAKLFVYKNNLAFFVYCIESNQIRISDCLMEFQNRYKEFSYPQAALLIEKDSKKKVCAPIYLGAWIAKEFDNIPITYLPSRNNPYQTLQSGFDLYMPKNWKLEFDDNGNNIKVIPDKAICFSYAKFKNNHKYKLEQIEDFAYHIAKGYSSKYKFSKDGSYEMSYPFHNTVWCAANEGYTYVVYNTEDNLKFYTQTLPSRLKEVYLYLFIRSLFERYSILKYSHTVASKFPYNIKEYNNIKTQNEISSLQKDVNVFKTKVMTKEVSTISHVNGYYSLLNKSFHNDDNSISLIKNLKSLNDIQKQADSDRLNYFLAVIATIELLFATPQLFSLIKLVFSLDNVNSISELFLVNKIAFIIFICLCFVVIGSLVSVIYYIIKKRINSKEPY